MGEKNRNSVGPRTRTKMHDWATSRHLKRKVCLSANLGPVPTVMRASSGPGPSLQELGSEMTLDVEPERSGPPMPTILIVGSSALDAMHHVPGLAASEFHVVGAEDFASAKAVLLATPPQMLITDVRLHEYNGLHLVLRAKAAAPNLAALVLSSYQDSVLESEANALGATFVVTPIQPTELVAAVRRTLFRLDNTPIRPPFERRISAQRHASAAVGADDERRRVERRRDHAAPAGLLRAISDDQLT